MPARRYPVMRRITHRPLPAWGEEIPTVTGRACPPEYWIFHIHDIPDGVGGGYHEAHGRLPDVEAERAWFRTIRPLRWWWTLWRYKYWRMKRHAARRVFALSAPFHRVRAHAWAVIGLRRMTPTPPDNPTPSPNMTTPSHTKQRH